MPRSLEICLPLLILVLVGIILAQTGFAIDWSQVRLHNATPGGIAMGLVLVLFAFSGFESATTLGDEAKNPLRSIPRAVMGSAIMAGLFFMVTAYTEILGFGQAGVSIATNEEPLGFLAHRIGLGLLGDLVTFSALFSFFACVLGSINPAARVFFTMARHGLSGGDRRATDRSPFDPALLQRAG